MFFNLRQGSLQVLLKKYIYPDSIRQTQYNVYLYYKPAPYQHEGNKIKYKIRSIIISRFLHFNKLNMCNCIPF